MKSALAFTALALCLSSAAAAQSAGDWVLSQWQGSSQFYPGVVQSRSGNMLRVRYDDGSVADVRVDAVQPYNWRVGSLVECQWTDGEWYGARITSMASDGLSIGVRYEDGVNQKTNTGKCRSR